MVVLVLLVLVVPKAVIDYKDALNIYVLMSVFLDVAIILISVALGALFGINFQRHEDEKAKNTQSRQHCKSYISDTDGSPESEINATGSLKPNNSDGAPFKWA